MSRIENGAEKVEGEGWVTIKDASEEAVERVVFASEHSKNGRSQWVWVRLPNGDLVLGVFPQGDTYCMIEGEAP